LKIKKTIGYWLRNTNHSNLEYVVIGYDIHAFDWRDFMLQIAGRPFKQSDMWEPDSSELVIIKRMQEANVIYSYQTIDELLFELKLRKNIISSAKEMSKGKARFHTFANSRGNQKYWQISNAGGFLLRRGVNPSDAIKDIFINSSLYTFECATATIMIYYYAFLKLIGDTVFNRLFQNLYLYSWHLDSDFRIITFYGTHLLPGDVIYFNNPDVNPKTFWWRGENAVDMGDGTYFGHGFGIRPAKEFIEILNEKRRPGSRTSAYLTNLITRPDFKGLATILGYSREDKAYKHQHRVIHHNQPSISFAHYLYYYHSDTYKNTN
jgi:protein-glutamine gamma-glutamyltransferase